jgi:hypothetical protein
MDSFLVWWVLPRMISMKDIHLHDPGREEFTLMCDWCLPEHWHTPAVGLMSYGSQNLNRNYSRMKQLVSFHLVHTWKVWRQISDKISRIQLSLLIDAHRFFFSQNILNELVLKNDAYWPGTVAQACIHSHLGGGASESCSSRSAWAKVGKTLSQPMVPVVGLSTYIEKHK